MGENYKKNWKRLKDNDNKELEQFRATDIVRFKDSVDVAVRLVGDYGNTADSGNASTHVLIPQMPWEEPAQISFTAGFTNWCSTGAWSPGDQYLALASWTESPYIHFYKRDGAAFTKLPDPSVLPNSQIESMDWSPCGNYVACLSRNGSKLQVFKRTEDEFNLLPDPAGASGTFVGDVRWSPQGDAIAIGVDAAPFLQIYGRQGDSISLVAEPTGITGGPGSTPAWSPDGRYLAFSIETQAPHIKLYKREDSTYTQLPDIAPDQYPTTVNGVAALRISWSPDGTVLASAENGVFYDWDGTQLTLLPIDIGSAGSANFSRSGRYMSRNSGGNMQVYEIGRQGADITADLATTTDVGTFAFSGKFSNNGEFLYVTHTTAPYCSMLQTTGEIKKGAVLRLSYAMKPST